MARTGPRLLNDPDAYIRTIPAKGRGGRILYQVRPYDEGVRYDLGLFDTIGEARKARDAFWWGKRESLPRLTRRVRRQGGIAGFGGVYGYVALKPGWRGGTLGVWDTREAAHARVAVYVIGESYRRAEREEIGRPPDPADPPDRDVLAVVQERAAELTAEVFTRRAQSPAKAAEIEASKAATRQKKAEQKAATRARREAKRQAERAERERRHEQKRAARHAAARQRWQAWQDAAVKVGRCPPDPGEAERRYQAGLARQRAKRTAAEATTA